MTERHRRHELLVEQSRHLTMFRRLTFDEHLLRLLHVTRWQQQHNVVRGEDPYGTLQELVVAVVVGMTGTEVEYGVDVAGDKAFNRVDLERLPVLDNANAPSRARIVMATSLSYPSSA